MRTLDIDLETYGELDIKKVGVYKYSESCELLLCAYAFDEEPVKIIDIASGEKMPRSFLNALFDTSVLKTAYNAAFEIRILSQYLGKVLKPEQWACTMLLGLALGLPAGLEQLGKVLNLESDKQKLATGKKLIRYFCKPQSVSSDNHFNLFETSNRNFPRDNVEKWRQFKEYCKQDVASERAIRQRLDKYPTTDFEKKLWCLDQKINGNGVLVDMGLVKGAITIDAEIRANALDEGAKLTGGLNLNSNAQMLNWFKEQEGWLPASLDKASRADLSSSELTSQVKKFLELKEILSKTSVKKYEAMRATACSDNRARGMFQFYGANRTGRWAGRLIQLQNLPQNHLDDLDVARQFVKRADTVLLNCLYDNPSNVLSQLIRTAFIAPEGSRFIVADFSAIEARVIAWIANEKWRMKVFADGGDIYCASASEMFKVPVEKHGRNKELRQKGKIAELACGYGGGVGALKAFGADKMGLTATEMQAIIDKWRKSSPNICKLWSDVENCAKSAINGNKTAYKKLLVFEKIDDFLFITLSSGRKISYYKPRISDNSITYEGNVQTSGGWGTNRTWGGKLVENIVQAVARDCLAVAMTRVDAAGYKIVMHIHDEIVCEMPEGVGSLAEVVAIMSKPIDWAEGLILNADGYETPYYKKD